MKLCIYSMMAEVFSAGFPHSDIRGSLDMCSSPRLFAACHVFRRLPVPRHPPCALLCLTFSLHSVAAFCLRFVLFFVLTLLTMKLTFQILYAHAVHGFGRSEASVRTHVRMYMQDALSRENRRFSSDGRLPYRIIFNCYIGLFVI